MPSQSFLAHCQIVADDLGLDRDVIVTHLKTLAQARVDDALRLYSEGVKDSYLNGAAVPVADLISQRLSYMSLFD